MNVKACVLSHARFFATPWTVARQPLLSMEFARQDFWSELSFPTPGDPPHPGIPPWEGLWWGTNLALRVTHSILPDASARACAASLKAQIKKSPAHTPIPVPSAQLWASGAFWSRLGKTASWRRQLRSTGAINPKGHWSLSCRGAGIQLPTVTAAWSPGRHSSAGRPNNLSTWKLPDKQSPTPFTSSMSPSWAQTSADQNITQVTVLKLRSKGVNSRRLGQDQPGGLLRRTHFPCRNKDQKNWSSFQAEPGLSKTTRAKVGGKERERENPNEFIWPWNKNAKLCRCGNGI